MERRKTKCSWDKDSGTVHFRPLFVNSLMNQTNTLGLMREVILAEEIKGTKGMLDTV